MLYFVVGARELDGGAMITASHNPKAYTGVKLVREGALALSGETGITRIRDLIRGRPRRAARRRQRRTRSDVYAEFHERAMSFIDEAAIKPLKVVVDGGNGMAGRMVGPLLERLPVELVTTYWEPDGNFPDHEPNPLLPENREFIIDRVKSEGADLGIAWDGDADRCFFIDDAGEFVDGDFLTALLAELVLEKSPGADILYDVRASRAVPDTVAARGWHGPRQPGRPRVHEAGDARAGRRVRRRGLRSLLLPRLLQRRHRHDSRRCSSSSCSRRARQRLSELVGDLRSKYFISGEINSEVDDPEAKMKEIAAAHPDAEIAWLDGVSVDYPDWHFNVRPSNTEPLLRLNLESLVSREDMERRRDEMLAFIRA